MSREQPTEILLGTGEKFRGSPSVVDPEKTVVLLRKPTHVRPQAQTPKVCAMFDRWILDMSITFDRAERRDADSERELVSAEDAVDVFIRTYSTGAESDDADALYECRATGRYNVNAGRWRKALLAAPW